MSKRPHYKIVNYESAEECFAACINEKDWCDTDIIKGYLSDGKPFRMMFKTYLKHIKKRLRWGFHDRKTGKIHIWFDKRVKLGELTMLLAHELAHTKQSKYMPNSKKEANASMIGEITSDALGVASALLDSTTKRKTSMKALAKGSKLVFT